MNKDRHPLSYWMAVARSGFENDLHRLIAEDQELNQAELARRTKTSEPYVSKLLHGAGGNYEIKTMAKFARALGAILQIRLVREGSEVVRVVDYETAGLLDDARAATVEAGRTGDAKILHFDAERVSGVQARQVTAMGAGDGWHKLGGGSSG